MRQLVLEQDVDKNGIIVLEGKKFHYLKSVLRVKSGDMIYARLPGDKLMQMTVALIEDKRIVLQLAGNGKVNINSGSEIKAPPSEKQNQCELFLFQFVAKPPKMELIIRQAVECGVRYIVPVAGAFCQKGNIESAKKRSEEKNSRWDNIITEALQQSGSAVETEVTKVMSVKEAIDFWTQKTQNTGAENKSLATVLYEQTSGTQKLHEAFKNSEGLKCAAIAVGAEGGIMPEEIKQLSDAGFIPIHFDTNILRCETAALYGIAAIQTVLMEKQLWQFKE